MAIHDQNYGRGLLGQAIASDNTSGCTWVTNTSANALPDYEQIRRNQERFNELMLEQQRQMQQAAIGGLQSRSAALREEGKKAAIRKKLLLLMEV